MGVKDQGLQEYLKDNERFADLVNGTLFAGKQIIKASYLKEVQRKKRVSCQLQEMMEIPEEVGEFSSLLPEYDICMADIHEQNPQLFHTEWRDIFSLMRHSRKKEELKKYIEDNKPEIQKLSLETRWFLAILLEQYTIVDDGIVEVRDVCKAWDGAMQMYADEAREEMKKQQAEKNRRVVSRMFSKGYPQAEIADMLEIPLKTVKRWCAGLTPAAQK